MFAGDSSRSARLRDTLVRRCGQLRRHAGRGREPEIIRPGTNPQPLAFSGIHVISPRLLSMLTEDGVFSIIDSYLRLAGQGETISAFRADSYYWRDLGKPESIQQAAKDIADMPAFQ
jgi:NDP-sugar pyrophosphorylase family protein